MPFGQIAELVPLFRPPPLSHPELDGPPIFTEPGWSLHRPAEIGIDGFQARRHDDFFGLGLSDDQRADLVEYLKSL